jgi:bacillithiol biosynthesis cysteine-adding enzyme BshC
METDCIPFQQTGYFSKIVIDYLKGENQLKPFYDYEPSLAAFEKSIAQRNFPRETRTVLFEALKEQYLSAKIKVDRFPRVKENLEALLQEQTYTITTGHQLCLFTGPLYFIYKIVSIIKLTERLKERFPDKNFVPVYWMATEDHDFAEINHFRFKGEKLEWKTGQKGAVGRMSTEGLEKVFEQFSGLIVDYASRGEELKALFKKAYLEHDTLAAATRFLVNELFASEGVIIVDGDDSQLKRQFIPTIRKELLEEFSSHAVEAQSKQLASQYKLQVNPREINLFYLEEGSRERIVKSGENYLIHNREKSFTEKALLEELNTFPEKFSPNVLLRPLYQESILPNLAYIGGGGELAYWFQLNSTFKEAGLAFPVLILRNSALWMDEKQSKYYKSLNISAEKLFLSEGVLTKEWVKENCSLDLSLQEELKNFEEAYHKLAEKAGKVAESLKPHVEALASRQLKHIQHVSEKMIRAERKQQKAATDKISYLKETLFPGNGLQERTANFSDFYLFKGKDFIDLLKLAFEVPASDFILFM